MGNEELVHMYQKRLGDAGYITFQLARTNNRGDGEAAIQFSPFSNPVSRFNLYVSFQEKKETTYNKIKKANFRVWSTWIQS